MLCGANPMVCYHVVSASLIYQDYSMHNNDRDITSKVNIMLPRTYNIEIIKTILSPFSLSTLMAINSFLNKR